jgi:HK97 family phage prohead protease
MTIERRALSETVTLRSEGGAPSVSGYASMYNTETVIAGLWREQIAPGAFASALDGSDDVRALFNHDPNILLGRTKSGTLRLSEDKKGLRYDVDLPDTQQARDVRELIKRGDVTGSSFGFTIEEDEWDESEVKRGKLPLLTIRKVSLFDVSPVTYPAYPQTSVSARAKGEAAAEEIRRFLQRQQELGRLELVRARIAIARARAWAV